MTRERFGLCRNCHSGQIMRVVHRNRPVYWTKDREQTSGSSWFPSTLHPDGLCEYCYKQFEEEGFHVEPPMPHNGLRPGSADGYREVGHVQDSPV